MPNRIERDTRTIHDQVADHQLNLVPPEKLMAMVVVELRRVREQLAELIEVMRGGSASGTG